MLLLLLSQTLAGACSIPDVPPYTQGEAEMAKTGASGGNCALLTGSGLSMSQDRGEGELGLSHLSRRAFSAGGPGWPPQATPTLPPGPQDPTQTRDPSEGTAHRPSNIHSTVLSRMPGTVLSAGLSTLRELTIGWAREAQGAHLQTEHVVSQDT